jgi:hypothetical protein
MGSYDLVGDECMDCFTKGESDGYNRTTVMGYFPNYTHDFLFSMIGFRN